MTSFIFPHWPHLRGCLLDPLAYRAYGGYACKIAGRPNLAAGLVVHKPKRGRFPSQFTESSQEISKNV